MHTEFFTESLLVTDMEALRMVDDAYQDREEWIKKSIRTTAKVRSQELGHDSVISVLMSLFQMGKFSSDRSINDYAQEYWNIESLKIIPEEAG
jgi:glycogen phosphorylase